MALGCNNKVKTNSEHVPLCHPACYSIRVGASNPRSVRELVSEVPIAARGSTIHALLDNEMIDAFGFPRRSKLMRKFAPAALGLRAAFAALLPGRRGPRLRTEICQPTYPDGYVIQQLGPPETS
jgi:hypothetical protein